MISSPDGGVLLVSVLAIELFHDYTVCFHCNCIFPTAYDFYDVKGAKSII